MPVSQNGWTINPPLADLTVHGVTFGGAHTGDAHVVLEYVATRYDAEVERLIAGTCGCYNPRKIPGSDVWSNHASATAIDCNWQRHPLGARGTYTAAQVRAIRRILADCNGVIRWGGDYNSTVDEMHFEINKNAAAVKALADKIRSNDMALTDPQGPEAVAIAQAAASKWGGDTQPPNSNSGVATGLRYQVAQATAPILTAVQGLASVLANLDEVDETALANALAPALSASVLAQLEAFLEDHPGSLTAADVETALRDVLRTGTEAA